MRRITAFILYVIVFNTLSAQQVLVEDWLVTGVFPLSQPALAENENVKGEKFKASDLLKMPLLDISKLKPQANTLIEGSGLKWEIKNVSNDSSVYLNYSGKSNGVAFIATYLQAENFWKGMLAVESTLPFEVYLNDSKVSDRYSASTDGSVVSKEVKLYTGKQCLLIKLLVSDTLTSDSRLKVYLKPSADFLPDGVVAEINPEQTKTMKHLLEGQKLSGVSISSTGDMAMITVSEMDTKTEKANHTRRVVRIIDGRLIASFRQAEVSQIKWMPKGNKLSFLLSGNLWVYDIEKGTEVEVLKGLNDISSYSWSKNEQFIIYHVSEKDDSQKGDIKRILTMEDRQSHWRSRSFLYMGTISTGIHERLTWGNRSTWLEDISPDGKNILFSVSQEDYSERPYRRNSLLRLDLASRKLDTLWADKLFGTSVSYSPDGLKLLATGGPLAFGNTGVNVKEGKIPNGYDTQAFIYDIATGNIDAITRNFDPSIRSGYWCPLTNNIYFNTVDQDWNTIYEYNPRSKKFTPIKLNEEMVSNFDIALEKQVAVYNGSGMNSWNKAYFYDFKTKKSTLLADIEKDSYKNVKFGATKEWSFNSSAGQKVSARYYLPPHFDSNKKYPMIVYYYGGTTPVGRDFGGRYPKELYAAHGFVVLVLQPTGAIGFGQDFSADHVNAWGEITADEIIEGTKKFAQDHAFVNEKKIGCIGASYGGFMTMYLLTRTDIFAAAISHAGISSISSYWGEGFWGYAYSAEASANSFPWNNHDLYVNRSPLFSAHKVVTPLLLLHGTDDTNVPVGESIQMFTALKLLGKTVELIQVDGEDHFIVKYNRRVQWTNSILAWFSYYLKDETGWWNDMYPEKNY